MAKSTEISRTFPSTTQIDDRIDTVSNLVDVHKAEPRKFESSSSNAASTSGAIDDLSSSSNDVKADSDTDASSPSSMPPPPAFEDIDRWNYHIDLQEFGASLQAAARAVFPNEQKSRYLKVSVLMLSWADEDPRLPVSQEIDALQEVFRDVYHFETERWEIPGLNSHYKLAGKIMEFVKPEEDSKTHLKIVYYAGHARLMETRTLAWTSWQNKKKAKCTMVKWGAIQSFLEDAANDSLILLDCCASGTANTCEGNGTTELISACAWNETANGVGPYSLSSALVIELRRLSQRASFSVGELYRNVFMRTQNRMPEDIPTGGRERERHPAPIHLILTQDTQQPRSIHLSVKVDINNPKNKVISTGQILEPPIGSAFPDIRDGNGRPSVASHISTEYSLGISPRNSNIREPLPSCEKGPRLAFAVRLSDTFRPDEDIRDLFLEWLRNIPIIAQEVKIEASFDSFSTLLVLSLPVSMSAYLPRNPAVMSLGPVISGNRICPSEVAHHSCVMPLAQRVELLPSGIIKPDDSLPKIASPSRSPALPNPPSPETGKEQNASLTPHLRQTSDLVSKSPSPAGTVRGVPPIPKNIIPHSSICVQTAQINEERRAGDQKEITSKAIHFDAGAREPMEKIETLDPLLPPSNHTEDRNEYLIDTSLNALSNRWTRGNQLQQRDFSRFQQPSLFRERRPFLDITQHDRFINPLIHPRVLNIEAALRDCARLPIKDFALIIVLENGEEKTYTSQSLTTSQSSIFSDRFKLDFRRSIRRAAKRSATESDSDEWGILATKKKRKRHHGLGLYTHIDYPPVPVSVPKQQLLRIGDEAGIEEFYVKRFKDMQQSACKVMGKAFVKLLEPKKQTHHPYTKGNDKAPSWWPNTTGDNRVRHKEPDHLMKAERIRLLVHILRMIVEPPGQQHPTVQKQSLSVHKLEEVTMEAMSIWFSDEEHPENIAKKPFLREIFKVAKAEERYKSGEIDRDTLIPVMYNNRSGSNRSDDEVGEEVGDKGDQNNASSVFSSIVKLEAPPIRPLPAWYTLPLPMAQRHFPAIPDGGRSDSAPSFSFYQTSGLEHTNHGPHGFQE